MKSQFVTCGIALKLKELGFNERCFAEYTNQETLIIHYPHECFYGYCNIDEYDGIDSYSNSTITAPLWQQAIDWLREKYIDNIIIMPCIIPSNEIKYYIFKGKLKWDRNELYNTYEDAREQAILKAIELCQEK